MSKPYVTCPYCGDHLDHGETCTCRNEETVGKSSGNPRKPARAAKKRKRATKGAGSAGSSGTSAEKR